MTFDVSAHPPGVFLKLPAGPLERIVDGERQL
jgi:hypothetical protein